MGQINPVSPNSGEEIGDGGSKDHREGSERLVHVCSFASVVSDSVTP